MRTLLRVPIIRVTVFGVLPWSPLIFGELPIKAWGSAASSIWCLAWKEGMDPYSSAYSISPVGLLIAPSLCIFPTDR